MRNGIAFLLDSGIARFFEGRMLKLEKKDEVLYI
jgi:hypothetical protein